MQLVAFASSVPASTARKPLSAVCHQKSAFLGSTRVSATPSRIPSLFPCPTASASASSPIGPSFSYAIPSFATDAFQSFFAAQPGVWNSSRIYHYVPSRESESSKTTFEVDALTPTYVLRVVDAVANAPKKTSSAPAPASARSVDPRACAGFKVSFYTKMESQEELVCNSTNLVFVPRSYQNSKIFGEYLRDVGYEENSPIQARFEFDCENRELTMVTFYTRVVSVDTITLVNPTLRLRRIVNYERPPGLSPGAVGAATSEARSKLTSPLLVGYGLETRGDEQRLVPLQK